MRPPICLIALFWGACTTFEAGDQRLLPESDESPLQPESPGDEDPRGCLGEPVPEPMLVSVASQERWVLSAQVLSLTTGEAVAGVRVRACVLADVTCATPVADVSATLDGWVDIGLLTSFNGYLELTGPGILPTLVYFTRLSASSLSYQNPLVVVETDLVAPLANVVGATFDPDLGILVVRAFDCQGRPFAGVQVTHNRGGIRWFFVDGLPSRDAEVTGAEGMGGFINVEPGVSLVSVQTVQGDYLARDKSVVIRPGWFTTIWSDPSGTFEATPQ